MARNLMPKSGIMMPYVVVSRDAAVVGVSTVDGKAGAIDLTATYRKITDSYDKTETYTKTEVDNLITPIMTGALFKADPFVNNNVPFRSGGANGVTSINLIKANTDNSIHIGDIASGVQGVHIFSEGRVDVIYKNDAGAETVAPMYSKRYRPEVADMPFAAVGDYVLDSKGRTIAVNRTGINSDLKTLNALTNISTTKVTFEKSPTIPDAAQPYDAVNLRQLQAAGGGSGGASMNGVMNNFIGAVQWFNGSRAKLPAGYIAADGQKVLKADYPDLWTAVNSNLLVSTNEATWIADIKKRASYAYDTSTTEFRVPDLNGQQSGSITGAFLRGHSSSAESQSGVVGEMRVNAAPNITGTLASGGAGAFNLSNNSGAFQPGAPYAAGGIQSNGVANLTSATATFDASRSNAAYGRDSAAEVRPNSAVGIWIIRASGSFTAQNTNFNVITGDAAKPASGTLISGGSVASVYQVAGVDYAKAEIKVKSVIDGKPYAEVAITDNSSGTPSINNLRLGPPKSYIDGLDLYISSTDVTVYPGSAMLATGEFVEVVNSITKTLPAKTASTFYYVYLFLNAGVPDIEVSTTAPTKYSGKASSKGSDLTRRFLGYYRVTSSSEVAECSCINGTTRFTGPVDATSLLRIMANGVATSYTQIPIAGYIVAGIARSIIFDGTNTASGAVASYSGMSGRTYSTFQSGNNKYEAEVFFNDPASPQLWYKYSSSPGSTGFYVDIKGFRYDR